MSGAVNEVQALVHVFAGVEVRTMVDDQGRELWAANDIAMALEYKNCSQAIHKNVSPENIRGISTRDSTGRMQKTTFLLEPGMWELIIKSRKPNSKPFQKWVFETVLPSIRKHGGYHVNPKVQRQLEQLTEETARLRVTLGKVTFKRLGQELHKLGLTPNNYKHKYSWKDLVDHLDRIQGILDPPEDRQKPYTSRTVHDMRKFATFARRYWHRYYSRMI